MSGSASALPSCAVTSIAGLGPVLLSYCAIAPSPFVVHAASPPVWLLGQTLVSPACTAPRCACTGAATSLPDVKYQGVCVHPGMLGAGFYHACGLVDANTSAHSDSSCRTDRGYRRRFDALAGLLLA